MNTVKLVSITQPCIPEASTPEELIAYCARVSNPTNQSNHKTSGKLLKYCADNCHWSIFEQVSATMEIETTRDIARQILRHRSFSFQEFSQRYAEVKKFSTVRECRFQDTKNRQNSIASDVSRDYETIEWFSNAQNSIIELSYEKYKEALSKGIAKEQARVLLPEGLTMSRLYMTGSIRSWIHYCKLRCGNGTQKEHRDIASACREIILDKMPSLKEVLSD